MSGRPLPSSFDDNSDFYNESGFQKVLRRIKEEPLVPIGCILTVAAFTNAYRATRRGDHRQVQRMFRARVAAQAFTVVAMVAGGMYYSADRHKQKELWKLQQQEEAEEKRQKWIKELESRDEEDRMLKERLEKRRRRAAERGTGTEGIAAQAKAALEAETEKAASHEAVAGARPGTTANEGDVEKKGGGVLGSLGGWLGSSKPGPRESAPTSERQKSDSEIARK